MTDLIAVDAGIRQLHAHCLDAVWRKDPGAFADCYAEQGIWKIAGRAFCGRAEIADGFARLLSVNERVLMNFSTPVLEVGEGRATGRTYTSELVKRLDGTSACTIGVYYEKFVEQGGRWLFAWRHFDLHYLGAPDLTASFFEFQDYGPPPGMPGEDTPTGGPTVDR